MIKNNWDFEVPVTSTTFTTTIDIGDIDWYHIGIGYSNAEYSSELPLKHAFTMIEM